MYVTDTHPLVYYVDQKLSRLGRNARRIFNEAEDGRAVIYIPSVVLWEVGKRLREGDLTFHIPFDRWCRSFEGAPGFLIAPLGWEDVDHARSFPFKDPFDSLIAGTATHLGMPLITRDAEICDSNLIETIW